MSAGLRAITEMRGAVWIRYDAGGELLPVIAGFNEDQLHDKNAAVHVVFPSLSASELRTLEPYLAAFRNLRLVVIGHSTYQIKRSYPATRIRMTLAANSPPQSVGPSEKAAA